MKKYTKSILLVLSLLLIASAGLAVVLTDDSGIECNANFSKRYMYLKYTTAAQKSAYWQAHLQNVLNTYTLTTEQETIVHNALNEVSDEAFFSNGRTDDLEDTQSGWGAILNEINTEFSQQEIGDIFLSLPEYNPGNLSQADEEDIEGLIEGQYCTCNQAASACGIWTQGVSCTEVSCRTPRAPGDLDPSGCGPFWVWTCNGRCRSYN